MQKRSLSPSRLLRTSRLHFLFPLLSITALGVHSTHRAIASKFSSGLYSTFIQQCFESWLIMTQLVEPVPKMRCDCPGERGVCVRLLQGSRARTSHRLYY